MGCSGFLISLAKPVSGLALCLAASFLAPQQGSAAPYDPLLKANGSAPAHLDITVHDSARQRDIPLRIYLPADTGSAPVILFSHGLGGSRMGSVFLGEHWAARGYVAVFLQHPGSDTAVWQSERASERMRAMKQAVSLENFLLRVQDVTAVLNQLGAWEAEKGHALAGRLNLEKVGMSGHSFGAITTEAVSGETFPGSGQKFTDRRIKAAMAFSPSVPAGISAEKAFGSVSIPWMLMTGTKDNAPIGKADAKSRRQVYPALHGIPKYEVVLDNANHFVFTDRPLPGDREARNPNHHRVILALSTAFWDTYLRGNAEAQAWLTGAGPKAVMEPLDQWRFSEH